MVDLPKTMNGITPRIPAAVGKSKFTFAWVGLEKSGKTTCAFSLPQPIHAAYVDPNTATVDGLIRDGADITLWPLKSWDEFEEKFVPSVANRCFDAASIVVDSYSFLANMLVQKVKPQEQQNTFRAWDQIKQTLLSTTNSLFGATQPREGKPSYHVGITAHLADVYNKNGQLLKYRPAIQGSFKDDFGRMPGTYLICASETDRKPETIDGVMQMVTGDTRFFCWSKPPSDLYACGDSVGGKGGYKELPAQVDGTYAGLMTAWGRESELGNNNQGDK
jgi:hypothetical protein